VFANEGGNYIAGTDNITVRFKGMGVEVCDAAKGGDHVMPRVTAVAPKDGYVVSKGDEVVQRLWIKLRADID